MDTRFSVAIQVLVLISESDKNLTSQVLAQSVGTNSSYIRKIIGLLKKGFGSFESWYKLSKKSTEITLLDIYYTSLEKIVLVFYRCIKIPTKYVRGVKYRNVVG